MRKKIVKIGVLGMALIFTLGVSFNALASDTAATATITKDAQTQTVVSSNVVSDQKTVLTDAEKAQRKLVSDANFKKVLDYYVGTGAVTQADADAAYKLITESAKKIDMKKLPASVKAALKDLRSIKKDLTDTQILALRTTMVDFFKVEIQKLVATNVLTSDLAAKLLSHEVDMRAELTTVQKDAIKVALMQAGKNTLSKLMQDGTLTKDQVEKFTLLKNHIGMGYMGYINGNGHHGHNGLGDLNKSDKNHGHKNFKKMNAKDKDHDGYDKNIIKDKDDDKDDDKDKDNANCNNSDKNNDNDNDND